MKLKQFSEAIRLYNAFMECTEATFKTSDGKHYNHAHISYDEETKKMTILLEEVNI